MNDIINIYEMLHWRNPQEIRLNGMEKAKKVGDLSLLICPPAEPSVWECCATVLSEKSDADLEPYLDELIEWIYDLNWPGATTILERLKTFSGTLLKERLECAVKNALKLPDEEKTLRLYYLSELLDNDDLNEVLSKETLKELKRYYHML